MANLNSAKWFDGKTFSFKMGKTSSTRVSNTRPDIRPPRIKAKRTPSDKGFG